MPYEPSFIWWESRDKTSAERPARRKPVMIPREPPGEKKRGLGVITIVIAVSLLLLAVIFVTGQYALYGQVGRLRAQLGWIASHMRCCAPLQMEMRETSSWRGRGARLARDAVRPLAAKCVPQDRCES
jgi:hypothetical protein